MGTHALRQRHCTLSWLVLLVGLCSGVGLGAFAGSAEAASPLWLNHFGLLNGDPDVTLFAHPTNAFNPSATTGLVIKSTTAGEKIVHMALNLPRDIRVLGLRVCYEYPASQAPIDLTVKLARVRDPKNAATQDLPDPDTPLQNQSITLTDSGPHCVSYKTLLVNTPIQSLDGSMLLALGLDFPAANTEITIRALAIRVPSSAGGGF